MWLILTVALYSSPTVQPFIYLPLSPLDPITPMSLISDDYLLGLWSDAQSQPTSEWPSRRFWQQFLTKYIFDGKQFLVAAEEPSSSATPRRRVELIVRVLGRKGPSVLIFLEAKKPSATTNDLDDVEGQVLEACATYLTAHGLTHINAMTTVGTKARVWEYVKDSDYLTPIFGSESLSDISEYVEAHSSDGFKIKDALENIKKSASPEAPPHWPFLKQKTPTLGLLHLRLVSTASGSTSVWVQVQSSTHEQRTSIAGSWTGRQNTTIDGVDEHFRVE